MDLNLSHLITSTSFNSKTLKDIQKAIEKGADVNHQYADLDNNTQLHLAIANKNVECVKLLLKHFPTLNIRNHKGETAEDLATKVSHDEINKLLTDYRNNEYDSIDPKFIFELEENFSLEQIAKFRNDKNFRILKIKKCHSFRALFDKFKENDFKEAFSETSHLFAFIIEISKNKKEIFKFPISIFRDERPFVVIAIQGSQLPKVYYNDSKSKKLVKFYYQRTSSQRILEAKCPISYLVRELFINVLEKRSKLRLGNISSTLDILCLRLKKLSRSSLELKILPLNEPLPSDLENRFRAFYDLSFVEPAENWSEILIAVIKSNHTEVLKLILRNGFQTDCQKEHINTAWNLKYYECLTELLEADSCFPDDFNLDLEGQTFDKLRAIISTRNSFHDAIKAGNIGMINDLIDKNPQWKIVYNITNKSAVTIALESKRFEIYSQLRSRGFSAGDNTAFNVVINSLSVQEKGAITEYNKQFFNNIESSHLMHLLSQTKRGFDQGNCATFFAIVRSMYNKLDEIPEVQPILKYLENCKKLTIVIDLNKPHVMDMTLFAAKNTDGLTDPIRGYIYVAAQNYNERFYDILGVLAHELMHYAMDHVYNNDCKPYEVGNNDREKCFEKILRKIKKHWARKSEMTIDIICRVFDSYTKEREHAELIVRVPHLCALLNCEPETLSLLRHGFCKDLFKFYAMFTLTDINAKCELLKPQMEIEEVNKSIGLLHKIDKYDYKTNPQTLFSFGTFLSRVPRVVVNSNVSMLSLVYICQIMFKQFGKQMTKNVIFADIESLKNPHIISKIRNVCDSKVHPVLVVEANEKKYDSYESLKSFGCKMLIISCMGSVSEEDTKELKFKYLDLTHMWEDLNKNSQEKLKQKKVNFQGHEIKLYEILPMDSKELNSFPIEDLFSDHLEVNNFEPKQNRTIIQNFYVNRKFIGRKVQVNELRDLNSLETKIVETEMIEEKIIREAETRRVLIISDVAGMGKSTSLYKIAKTLQDKYRTHWVQCVDLKQHIRTFEQIKESEKSVPKLHEVLQKCINKSVDQMIFLELYKSGNAILLLDGVDEISPDFNNLIMEALKSFDVTLGNQLWIATRVHLQEGLEKQLGQLACKLLPITFEDQVEIVANYWKSKNKTVQDLSDLRMLASNLIVKISKGLKNSKSDLMEIPLQIRMIAEIYNGLTNENVPEVGEINLYSIYKAFHEKTFDNCLKNKGPLPSVSLQEMNKSSGNTVLTAHQTIALYNFFGSDFDFQDDVEDLTQETRELIDKVGIAYFDFETEKYCFIHESFAEYFVADYILANLKRKVQKKISQLLYLILTSAKYKMIRSFLDEAFKNKLVPAKISFCSLEKHLEENKLFKFLHESVTEGLVTLVKFIFCIMDSFKNNELKKEIVKCKTRINYSILMSACNLINCKGDMIRMVCEYSEKLLDENEMRTLVLEKGDEHGVNALYLVISFCDKNDVQLLLEMTTKLLNEIERKDFICRHHGHHKNGMNIWHFAARNQYNKEIFTTIHDSFKDILTENEIIPMLQQKDMCGYNVFHILIYYTNEAALDNFKAFVQNVFKNNVKLKQYLTEKIGEHGSNVLHMAAQMSKNDFFHDLWEFMKLFNDPVQLKDLLLETNKNGMNIWHFAAMNNINKEMFTTIQNSFKLFLTDLEIKPMLRQKNVFGFNVFHTLIYYSNEAALDDFKAFVQNVFKNKEEFKLYLTEKVGEDGANLLHLAAQKSKNDFFREFWNFLQLFCDSDELKDLLLATNKHGWNICHFAFSNGESREIFTTIHDSFKNVSTEAEIISMLHQNDLYGANVFHYLIFPSNKTALDDFKAFFQNVLKDKEELKLYFMKKRRKYDSNILHFAALHYENDFFLEILKFLQLIYDLVELKDLLLGTDKNGRNIWHFAANNGVSKIIFTTIRDSFKEILTDNEIVSMLRHQDKYGFNVFHTLICYSNEAALDDFKSFVENVFKNKKELKQYMREKGGEDGSNVLHLAAQYSKNDFFREIWNFLQYFCDHVEFNDFLLETNNNEKNILHCAAWNNDEQMSTYFFNHLESVLSKKDIKKLLLQICKHQTNILHIATAFNSSKNLEYLWNICTEFLDINEQKNFLQSCDADKDNIFHLAAYNAHHNFIFQTLIKCSQNVLTDEVKSLLQHKDNYGYNVLHALVIRNNMIALKEFYEMMKTWFDYTELQRFFSDKSISQSNAIQLMASCNTNIDFHESLNKILIEVFNDSRTEIKKIYLAKDENGQNAFVLAALNNLKVVYQSIWSFLDKICTCYEKTEILLSLGDKAVEIALDLSEIFDNEQDSLFLMDFVQSQLL